MIDLGGTALWGGQQGGVAVTARYDVEADHISIIDKFDKQVVDMFLVKPGNTKSNPGNTWREPRDNPSKA